MEEKEITNVFDELLKGKSFITKEFYIEPEIEEEKCEDFKYVPEKERANKVEEVKPVQGLKEALSSIENTVVGLFFSAGWCAPCQEFVPLLKDLYEELQMKRCPFQIVFISFDKTEEKMKEYFMDHHGEWLAIPFNDKTLREAFRTRYDVNSLPKLVIVKDTGEIITNQGRKEVQDRGYIGYRNWRQAANLRDNGTLHFSSISKAKPTL
ncbi:nucleoredoxin-like protein 2 [Saccostrea echinata]|uniref:nucleoredoxin-like protein 2 n=1 Tax=Saccostrea echinata TaxID=191078 RepID=UPI002A835C4C|nr:nucleoredoxin-like protein 2 [Saccostrea echinata]